MVPLALAAFVCLQVLFLLWDRIYTPPPEAKLVVVIAATTAAGLSQGIPTLESVGAAGLAVLAHQAARLLQSYGDYAQRQVIMTSPPRRPQQAVQPQRKEPKTW